jgi:3-hydroxybutyryl-CoA dehydrogenase
MELRTLGVVGGGVMGKSLAHKAAQSGIDVVVLEVSDERAEGARAQLVAILDRELGKWGITESEKQVILQRVQFTTDIDHLARADLIVEAIPDQMQAKKEMMQRLGQVCPEDRVFVTNTSTLSITEIAAASGRPDRVVGMHFAYPVTTAPLVEVVRGMETSDATFQTARYFAGALEKQIIEVFEYPGYVMTRAVLPLLNEVMYIVMEGVASAEDVDKAMRLGFEFKIGPLEYADRIGLDKIMSWMEHLFRELGDLKYRPCPLLRKHVRAGHLGRRVGRGFFTYGQDGRRILASTEAAP